VRCAELCARCYTECRDCHTNVALVMLVRRSFLSDNTGARDFGPSCERAIEEGTLERGTSNLKLLHVSTSLVFLHATHLLSSPRLFPVARAGARPVANNWQLSSIMNEPTSSATIMNDGEASQRVARAPLRSLTSTAVEESRSAASRQHNEDNEHSEANNAT
jgi:hypothetical protein